MNIRVCMWLVIITYLCEALRISNSERPLVIGYDFAGYIDIGGENCGFFLCADVKEGRKERERERWRGSMRSSRTWTQQLQLCFLFFFFKVPGMLVILVCIEPRVMNHRF